MKKAIVLSALIITANPVFLLAGPKPTTKIYSVSCAKLWDATKSTVRAHYDVLGLNDANRSGSFTTGEVIVGVRTIAFSLNGSGETCTISATGHFSGLVHNDKGDFFKRVQATLDDSSR